MEIEKHTRKPQGAWIILAIVGLLPAAYLVYSHVQAKAKAEAEVAEALKRQSQQQDEARRKALEVIKRMKKDLEERQRQEYSEKGNPGSLQSTQDQAQQPKSK